MTLTIPGIDPILNEIACAFDTLKADGVMLFSMWCRDVIDQEIKITCRNDIVG